MTRDEKAQKRKKKISSWIKNMRGGRSVSLQFMKDNGWLLALITVAILSLIGLRYKTETRMIKIKRLNTILQDSESEKIKAKQEYMTLIRQTRMDELVRENNLGLIHQEQPPYEIDPEIPAKPISPNKVQSENETKE